MGMVIHNNVSHGGCNIPIILLYQKIFNLNFLIWPTKRQETINARKESMMSKEIKYPEEVKEDAWDRVLRLFKELPETLLNTEGPRPDKRKTNNIGW